MTTSISIQPGYPDLSRLANAKVAVFAGNAKAYDAAVPMPIVTVPRGKVAVITRVVGNAGGVLVGVGGAAPAYLRAPTIASPATSVLRMYNTWAAGGGSPAGWFPYMPILNFDRNDQVHGSPSLALPPDVPIDWSPRHPIIVPSGGELGAVQNSYMGNKVACYGYIVDSEDARAMGFEVGDRGSPSTGFNPLVQTGRIAANGALDLIAAQTGYTIQILDIFARLQPLAAGAAAMTLADETGTVFKFRNDSQANMCEWKISPGLYLRKNEKLTLTGDATSANRGTVIVIARYVRNADVPSNAFWGYREPALPSPGGATVATYGKRVSSTVTLNYSGPATTATTPGQGRRHHVEGYCISATKDNTASSDHVLFALTTGTAGGNPGWRAVGVTQANNPISPVMTLSLPHQSVNLVVDRINVPCVAHTGLILVDTLGVAGTLIGTPAGEGDIQGWGVTVWGQTLPTEKLATDNPQFIGGISPA